MYMYNIYSYIYMYLHTYMYVHIYTFACKSHILNSHVHAYISVNLLISQFTECKFRILIQGGKDL